MVAFCSLLHFEIYAFIYRKFVGHWLDYARAKWGSLVGCCPESSQPFIILNLRLVGIGGGGWGGN